MSNSETVLASNSMAMWPFFRLLDGSTTKIAVYGLLLSSGDKSVPGSPDEIKLFFDVGGLSLDSSFNMASTNGGSFLIGTLYSRPFSSRRRHCRIQETSNQSPLLNIATIALVAETLIFYTEAGIGKINPDWLNSSVLEDMITALLFYITGYFLIWPGYGVHYPKFQCSSLFSNSRCHCYFWLPFGPTTYV